MVRWEYDLINVRDHENYNTTRNELNTLGRQGWEVVAITPAGTVVLKRSLPDPLPGEEPGPVPLMEGNTTWDLPVPERAAANN